MDGLRMTQSFSVTTLLLAELLMCSRRYVDTLHCCSLSPFLLGQFARLHTLFPWLLHVIHRLLLTSLIPNLVPTCERKKFLVTKYFLIPTSTK